MKTFTPTHYVDSLARRKRRRFVLGIIMTAVLTVGMAAFLIYGLFFIDWLQITDISYQGLKSITSEEIMPLVNSVIESTFLTLVKPQKNILFFNTQSIKDAILAQFPVIKSIRIQKEIPHKVILNFSERIPFGIWCSLTKCHYFDEEGVKWGNALKSSGSLLLVIEDQRENSQESKVVDPFFLGALTDIVSRLRFLDITIKRIVIPAGSLNDFRAITQRGYYLILSAGSEIGEQLDIFKIFLNEKSRDPNFQPEYIDLRIKGRVYYK